MKGNTARPITASIFTLLLAMGGFLFPATSGADASEQPQRVRLNHDRDAQQIEVYVRDEHFTTYNYGKEVRTPFLWPVHAEGGITITRNWPMGEDEPVSSTDHRHHRSMYLTFGVVNNYDFWHREQIRTRDIKMGSTETYAWIRARNEWLAPNGRPVVDEIQEYRFHDTPAGARTFDVIATFIASHGDVTFGDDKEGLFAFRIRPEIQGNRAGILTNAEGRQGERNVYGTPSRWMDYSGPVADVGHRGIALFDHPSSFRHPPTWHVRDYGLVAANPFGLSSVGRLGRDGTHVLEEGKTLNFVYRVYVHSGDVKQAEVAQRYEEFAAESFSPAAVADRPIRALLLTGGGWHDFRTQEGILTRGLSERLNIEWEIDHEAGDNPAHEPSRLRNDGWIDGFDIVVHSHSLSRVEDHAKTAARIVQAHERTGTPAVVIHGALHSFRHADDWHRFTGVVTRRHERNRPFEVKTLKSDHPVMQGLGLSWQPPGGELYIIEAVQPTATATAKAFGVDTKQDHVVIWTNQYGKARVFGTSIGHHNETMATATYLDMLARGMLWALDNTPAGDGAAE